MKLLLKIGISVLLLVTGIHSFAQRQKYIDSLYHNLVRGNDTIKIKSFNGLAWAFKYSMPDSALKYAHNAYDLSKKLNFTGGQSIALNRMSSVNIRLGNYEKALKQLLEAIEVSKKNNQSRILVTSYRQLGTLYQMQGNLSVAINNYYHSLQLADSIALPIGMARASLQIAKTYYKLKKYATSNIYLGYTIDEFNKQHYKRGLHQAYVLKGDLYLVTNKPDSALLSYKKASSLLVDLEDKLGKATITKREADVWLLQKEFNKTIDYYSSALGQFEKLGAKRQITELELAMGATYFEIQKLPEALQKTNIALEHATKWNLPEQHKQAHYLLYKMYKANAKPKKALAQLDEYLILQDSLLQASEDWRVDQLNKSFELEIQQKENALNAAIIEKQNAQLKFNKRIKNLLILLSIVGTLFLLFIAYALKKSRIVNAKLTRAIAEKNDAISLISHDLKSPFNKIKGLIHLLELNQNDNIGSQKEVIDTINTVTHEGLGLVQNLVDVKSLQSDDYTIKWSKFKLNEFLIKRVQSFEQLASTKNIKIKFEPTHCDYKVTTDTNAIARIFDNLVSNAIKFSPIGDSIDIGCNVEKNLFSFSVSDNGIGVSPLEIEQIFAKHKTGLAKATGTELSNGLGLAIVSSLVNKLGGTVSCISEPDKGVTFIVSLPNNLSST